MLDIEQLPAALQDGLRLDAAGAPASDVAVLALDEAATDRELAAALEAVLTSRRIVIGVGRTPLGPRFAELGSALLLTLVHEDAETAPWQVGAAAVEDALASLLAGITASPTAAHVLDRLLRITEAVPVEDGLTAESLAYSMLMAGPEHQRWLAGRSRKPIPDPVQPPVLLERDGAALRVVLNRPERHNAFGAAVRDGLAEAFDLVLADSTIGEVRVSGAGRSFCSGGDLDEFGLSADVSLAHLIRTDRSVAARLARVADRVTVTLHGACIGAGIELGSYAARVIARSGAVIRLPEVEMGLLPGAGGTVGITRRIGRWRTAYLAITGEAVDLETALRWGLIDEIDA